MIWIKEAPLTPGVGVEITPHPTPQEQKIYFDVFSPEPTPFPGNSELSSDHFHKKTFVTFSSSYLCIGMSGKRSRRSAFQSIGNQVVDWQQR